jgi:hypothetical protein
MAIRFAGKRATMVANSVIVWLDECVESAY